MLPFSFMHQCEHYLDDGSRCENEAVRSVYATCGGQYIGNGWWELKQEMTYWLCDDHYERTIQSLESLDWKVER